MTTKKPAATKAAAQKTDRPSTAVMPSNLKASNEINVVRPEVDIAPGISLMPSLMITANLVPFRKTVDDLMAMANRAVINSTESYERGIQFMTLNKGKRDQLEIYRKSVKGPVDDYAKLIQSMFMPLISDAEAAQAVVSKKMLAYKQEEQRKAQEAADAARRAQEEAAAKLAKALVKKGLTDQAEAVREAVAMAPPVVAVSSVAHVRAGGAAFQTRKTWVGTVEKPMEVLKAIIEGKLPISVIEFQQAKLNEFARDLKIKGSHLGILVDEVESGGVR